MFRAEHVPNLINTKTLFLVFLKINHRPVRDNMTCLKRFLLQWAFLVARSLKETYTVCVVFPHEMTHIVFDILSAQDYVILNVLMSM